MHKKQRKEPLTVEEVAKNQYTLDISYPTLGKKHERSITKSRLAELGLTLESEEYKQAYREIKEKMSRRENLGKIKVLSFVVQLKERFVSIGA